MPLVCSFRKKAFAVLLTACLFSMAHAQTPEGHLPPGLGGTYQGPAVMGAQVRYAWSFSHFFPAGDALPYRADYREALAEVVSADLFLELERGRLRHRLVAALSLPASLRTDPEAPVTNPLRQDGSSRHYMELFYGFGAPLLRSRTFSAWYGLSAALAYERLVRRHVSGLQERQWDAGLGLGPSLAAELPLTRRLSLRGEAHALVFLPYASYGKWETNRPAVTQEGEGPGEMPYHQLTLNPRLDGRINIRAGRLMGARLGYRYTVFNGYGNQVIALRQEEVVVRKLHGVHEVYLGIHFNAPGQWRKRKPVPSCPLSR
jgi:hypothetical protein